jgi:hypothetical protein
MKIFSVNGIVVYRSKFPEPDSLIEAIEMAQSVSLARKWENSQVMNPDGSSKVSSVRSNQGLFLPSQKDIATNEEEEAFIEISKYIGSHFSECLDDYLSRYGGSLESKSSNGGFNVLKYSSGTGYVSHMDDGPNTHRRVSAVGYLNDNFSGGGLRFQYLNFTYEPSAGDIVMFPSGIPYSHEAMPVTSGVKYSIASWWR